MFHFNAPKVEFLSNQSSPYSLFKQENKIPLQLLIFQSRFRNSYREPPTLCSKGFSWLVPSCFSDLSSKSRESECLADPSPSFFFFPAHLISLFCMLHTSYYHPKYLVPTFADLSLATFSLQDINARRLFSSLLHPEGLCLYLEHSKSE